MATRNAVRWTLGLVALATGLGTAAAQTKVDPQPASARVEDLIQRMTTEEKVDYIGGTGFAVRAVPRVGLPALEMSDGPYGVRNNQGFPSTTYAAGIGLAASWNRELAGQVGKAIARDARARGVNFMLGPGVNIYRSPRNGRNFEYFGEDPFLAAGIAVGYIKGIQSQGVAATVKHFAGNNSEFLRHGSDSVIEERVLREIYLPAFEAAVKQGHVAAVMDAYNLTNGQHMTQNEYLNTQVLRKDWGFDGVLMSDWTSTYDGVAAANSGLDLEMPTGKFMNRTNLLPALKKGQVSAATLDEKVRRILSTAERFHWLDRPQADLTIGLMDGENGAVALESARESIVLLKNEGGLLPLDAAMTQRVLVVGPGAYPGVPVGGGSAGVKPFHTVSLLEGMTAAMGEKATVLYDRGVATIPETALATNFVTAPTGGEPGLKLESFANTTLEGAPSKVTVEAHVSHLGATAQFLRDNREMVMGQFKEGGPRQLSRRWTGYYVAPQAGQYDVVLQGEGGRNRVYLDEALVIDNWKESNAFQPHLMMNLTAGPHKVVIEDFQGGAAGGKLYFAITEQSATVRDRAKELAKLADVVIIAAGFDADSEGESADRTFALPYGQAALIEAMAAANPRTVVVLTSGGNVDSSAWIGHVPAYLAAWYGGQSGGTAVAETLVGKVNPSGHLPVTFERRAEDNPTFGHYDTAPGTNRITYSEGIFVGYRGYDKSGVTPLFAFGHGLSYTTFRFSGLQVSGAGTSYVVSFDVRNTGTRAGAEVAQVYVAQGHAAVPRPQKELKGFEKVMLAPGETRRVSVPLDSRAFAYYDTAAKGWRISPDEFEIRVGDASDAIALRGKVSITRAAAAGFDGSR